MENVVFLSFKGSKLDDEAVTFSACSNCKNKTFMVIYDGNDYPMMKCAACGMHLGRIGWADSGGD